MSCFPMFRLSFCFMLLLGLYAHMLVMPCLDLCVHMFISVLYVQIFVFTCLYAWIHVLPCLCAKFLHVYTHVAMPMPRSMFSNACVLGSMFFTCFILSFMCLCALCHVCVPRPRLCLSCHVLL